MPQEKLVNIKLSDIEPNPNRDLKFNPFNEEKITALMASIGETGFWTNVIVRKSPEGNGYEQAYGHHRLESARRSNIKEADFIVRDLDENMMLKMMELENQEDYRYCPLSLLESVKAVVNALAAGRIAPFRQGKEAGTNLDDLRYAPSFVPVKADTEARSKEVRASYNAFDIGKYLGQTCKANDMVRPVRKIYAALDTLYLLEVKAITTAMIKDMNWSQLGKFVADIKTRRELVIKRTLETKQTAAEFDKQQREIQKQRKAVADEAEAARRKLVSELAKAKVAEDKPKVEAIKEKIAEKEQYKVEKELDLEVRAAELDKKVEQRKVQEAEAKKEDAYLPIKREVERILRKLEGDTSTTKEALASEVKALARLHTNNTDRERLRQAAMSYGTWFLEWVAQQFLPPLSSDKKLNEYRSREAANRRAADAKAEREQEKAERKASKEKKVAQSKK
jgi:ParB-like nuclease domain